MPRPFRYQLAVAAVSLVAACGWPTGQAGSSCGGQPVYTVLTGNYQVTAVSVDHDGCGLGPETLVGHPAFVNETALPTYLSVVLQSSRTGDMLQNGAGFTGSLACNSGQFDGSALGGSVGGCRYQETQGATVTADAADQMTVVVSTQLYARSGCTPAGDTCTTLYTAKIRRLPDQAP